MNVLDKRQLLNAQDQVQNYKMVRLQQKQIISNKLMTKIKANKTWYDQKRSRKTELTDLLTLLLNN
jgi:hypothetical protein